MSPGPISSTTTRTVSRRGGGARALDLVVLVLLSVPAALVALAIALAVRLESRGPVLYRARRVGQHAQPFDMLKFRKMHADAAGPALTAAHDERFTRIGKFLARTKLDELPQLLNVARGEMALVGPRPESERFVARYPEDFSTVLEVPPGITGPSQLQYFREHVLLDGASDDHYLTELLPAKLTTDRGYVETRSLAGDVALIVRTAWLLTVQLMAMARRVLGRSAFGQRTTQLWEAARYR